MLPGLTAAGALLVDYVLTASVSIASGVAQITSLVPDWLPYQLPIAVAAVVLIVIGNPGQLPLAARGARDSRLC
jgi:hypothetical protein